MKTKITTHEPLRNQIYSRKKKKKKLKENTRLVDQSFLFLFCVFRIEKRE